MQNYLGHSINAPTGRWQKNKDVHWYSRDKDQTADERREELRKIKEVEAEALGVALYVLQPDLGAFLQGPVVREELTPAFLSTGDLGLRNLDSQVIQHLPRPVRLDRTRYRSPYEKSSGNPSKRKKGKRNDGYKRLRRKPRKKRGG